MFSRSAQSFKNSLRSVPRAFQRRMAHASAEQQDAAEIFVRKYLPENEHIALAVMGVYGGIFTLAYFWPSSKKAKPAITPAPAAVSNDEIPAADTPEFGNWLAGEGNIEKFLGSLDK